MQIFCVRTPRVKLFRRENKGAKSRVFPSLLGSKSGRIRAITVEIIILAARITRALTMPVEPSALQNVSGKSGDECGARALLFYELDCDKLRGTHTYRPKNFQPPV